MTQVSIPLIQGSIDNRNKFARGALKVWPSGVTLNNVQDGDELSERVFYVTDGTTQTVNVSRQNFTFGQTAVPGHPKYFLRFDQTATDAGATTNIIRFVIPDVEVLSSELAIFGIFIQSDTATSISTQFVQHFGTSGSPSADVVVAGQALTVSTTWSRQFSSANIPTVEGFTLGLNGDDALRIELLLPNIVQTTEIALVQIEPGNIPSTFQAPDFDEPILLTPGGNGDVVLADGTGELKASANFNYDTAADLLTIPTRLWITNNTGDASTSSTGHPFQIGTTAGVNLIMDKNEIQSRTAGNISDLTINSEGGDVIVGGFAGVATRLTLEPGATPILTVGANVSLTSSLLNMGGGDLRQIRRIGIDKNTQSTPLTADDLVVDSDIVILTLNGNQNIDSFTSRLTTQDSKFVLIVQQNGTGGFSITGWPSNVIFPANQSPPTIPTGANEFLAILFVHDQLSFYGSPLSLGTGSGTSEISFWVRQLERMEVAYPHQPYNNQIVGIVEEAEDADCHMADEKNIFAVRRLGTSGTVAQGGDDLTSPSDSTYRGIRRFASDTSILVMGDGNSAGLLVYSQDSGATWSEQSVGGASDVLRDVAYDGSTYVLGSSGGRAFTAADTNLASWTQRTVEGSPGGSWTITRMIFANSIFVAGIDDSSFSNMTLYTSSDGITWTARTVTTGTAPACDDIIWNGTAFYYFQENSIFRSLDGITWTAFTAPGVLEGVLTDRASTDGAGSVLFKNDISSDFAAASFSEGDSKALVTAKPFDDVTFKTLQTTPFNYLSDVDGFRAYIRNGRLAGKGLLTRDGYIFTIENRDFLRKQNFSINSGATNTSGNRVVLSALDTMYVGGTSQTDRTSFKQIGTPTSTVGQFRDLLFDGTRYIIVGNEGSNAAIWRMTDTIAGTNSPYLSRDVTITGGPFTTVLDSVAYDGTSDYVAIGADRILRSTNSGATWASQTLPGSFNGNDIDYGAGAASPVFMAGGNSSGVVWTSTDGTSWTAATTLPSAVEVTIIRHALTPLSTDGTWIVSTGISNNIFRSIDNGTTWTTVSHASILIYDFIYLTDERVWIAIGDSSFLISFDDGQNWEQVTTSFSEDGSSLFMEGGLLISNTNDKYIYTFGNGKVYFTRKF